MFDSSSRWRRPFRAVRVKARTSRGASPATKGKERLVLSGGRRSIGHRGAAAAHSPHIAHARWGKGKVWYFANIEFIVWFTKRKSAFLLPERWKNWFLSLIVA